MRLRKRVSEKVKFKHFIQFRKIVIPFMIIHNVYQNEINKQSQK